MCGFSAKDDRDRVSSFGSYRQEETPGKRTAPADEFGDSEIICAKCWKLLPQPVRSRFKQLRRREKRLLRLIDRRVRAGDIRRTLVASGLDPAGRDELALLRYPDDRKQTRRADFAKEFCLVAIAGDDRGDFDELYQYIKDRDAAAPLDALIGNGWFLIPQPLT